MPRQTSSPCPPHPRLVLAPLGGVLGAVGGLMGQLSRLL